MPPDPRAMMPRALRDQLLTRRNIADAVIAVVNRTPEGAPGDRLYVAVEQHLPRADFDRLMRSLVYAERITACGNRFFPNPAAMSGPATR